MKYAFVLLFLVFIMIIGQQNIFSESYVEEKISMQVNGGKMINPIYADELGSMIFNLDREDQGLAFITVPKNVWHIADAGCTTINPLILVDGHEFAFSHYFEGNSRIFSIYVPEGSSQIELITSGIAAPHTTSLMYGKFCFLKEQGYMLSPKQQIQLGFMFYDVQCANNLVQIIKKDDNSPACVSLDTASSLIERGWGRFSRYPNSQTIKYENGLTKSLLFLTSAGIVVQTDVSTATRSIITQIHTNEPGEFSIIIPRALLDSELDADRKIGGDDMLLVLVNDEEVDYEEKPSDVFRILTIPFNADSVKIEIIPIPGYP